MRTPIRILQLEDDPRDAGIARDQMQADGLACDIVLVGDRPGFEAALAAGPWDVILCDYNLPAYDGLAALKLARRLHPVTPVIMLSGALSPEDAVECIRIGATDYLFKERPERLPSAVRRALQQAEEHELRLQAEQARRQALATLDATDDAVFIFDPATLRFSYVNDGAVRQLGYTREELLAMTPLATIPEFSEATFRDMIAPLLRGEARVRRFTAMHRRKDGHEIPVEVILQHIASSSEGDSPRFIAIVRDITERLQRERLAQHSQRLEALGTLASGVAHDLNNALAPVMMGVELLAKQHPDDARIVEVFRLSTRRAAAMVRQLLTFARGAVGTPGAVAPHSVLTEVCNMIQGTFPKNIELEQICEKGLPFVQADVTQLHQILLNLCVNARDAMPHGGTLKLRAELAEVDATFASSIPSIPEAKPGRYVVWHVRDTGIGIPPEYIDRIFDPFFTTKGPDKGTGLGLSTVMGIVKGYGGFVHVVSRVGQGSTFSIYLPVVAAARVQEPVPAGSASPFRGGGERILFVDDEEMIRNVAQQVLVQANLEPLMASDGVEGLIKAAENRAELRAVITDMYMPHMDGLNFTRALRRMLPDVPVLVVSGHLEPAVAEEFKALGVHHRLDKPFSEVQLMNTLAGMLAAKAPWHAGSQPHGL